MCVSHAVGVVDEVGQGLVQGGALAVAGLGFADGVDVAGVEFGESFGRLDVQVVADGGGDQPRRFREGLMCEKQRSGVRRERRDLLGASLRRTALRARQQSQGLGGVDLSCPKLPGRAPGSTTAGAG